MMKRKNPYFFERRGVFYAAMTALVFVALILLIVGGIFLYQINGDFYAAFRGGLHRGFYISTVAVLVLSSFIYAPFSFGISRYFIRSARGEARFSELFFLFRHPLALGKAALLTLVKKVLTYWERLLLRLAGALAEVGLFFAFLVLSGENVFSVGGNPFAEASAFMLRSPYLILLSVLLWCGVLIGFFIVFLRYVLCKYVLLCYPEVRVLQAIRVGRLAIRGNLIKTMLFYLRYATFFLLTLLSFGWFARRVGKRHRPFSVYATELVESGWRLYCDRRSGRVR